MKRIALVLALVGCIHPDRPPEPVLMEEAEPAWAAEYGAHVEAACACTEDACVREQRAAAEALVEASGGFEEAPPSVHDGRARLEACWLQVSKDLARDLDVAADRICACADSHCARSYDEYLATLTEKYGVVTTSALVEAEGADDAARAAWARGQACVAERTIEAARYQTMLAAHVDELCACQDEDCSRQAIGALDEIYATYYWIDGAVDTTALEARYCECYKDALARGFEVELTSTISAHVSVSIQCDRS